MKNPRRTRYNLPVTWDTSESLIRMDYIHGSHDYCYGRTMAFSIWFRLQHDDRHPQLRSVFGSDHLR